jgi:transposase
LLALAAIDWFNGGAKEVLLVSELWLLSEAQMRRIEPYFPLSHGILRVDDRRIMSGIIFVIRNGLRWRDAPVGYGPHKTIYNRFVRWSRLGVFNTIFAELVRPTQILDKQIIVKYIIKNVFNPSGLY